MKEDNDQQHNLSPAHWAEIVESSGVSDDIAFLNFKSISGIEAARLLNRRKLVDDGWVAVGIDPKTGEKLPNSLQFKPDIPIVGEDGRAQKYLSVSGCKPQPLFLNTGKPGFWSDLLDNCTTALFITEGAKKTALLLTLGYAAISVPGVWNGQLKGELKPFIKLFCSTGRPVYLVFDMDVLTKVNVQQALDRLINLLRAEGCCVWILLWDALYKGIDDLYVGAGISAVENAIRNPVTPEQWHKAILKANFDSLVRKLHAIFTESEDAATQQYELIHLSKSIKIQVQMLTAIYNAWRDDHDDIQPMTLDEFEKAGEQDREWLIANVLPARTTGINYSDPGVGKTLLAYNFGKAIAKGDSWNGYPTKQGRVLIIQTDEPSEETRERLRISGFFDEAFPKDQVMVLTRWSFSQLRKLQHWIEKYHPVFVVIDSLTSANRNNAAEEKDAPFGHCLLDIRDLADRYGCTIWVLHHSNRNGGLRGTTAIEANVSEVWKLRKPANSENLSPNQRVLEVGKSRSGCTGNYLLELDVNDYSWQWYEEYIPNAPPDLQKSSKADALLKFMLLEENCNQWWEPKDLAQELRLGEESCDAIRKRCERLNRRGLLESQERKKQHENNRGSTRYRVYRAVVHGRLPEIPDNVSSADVQCSDIRTAEDSLALDTNTLGNIDSENVNVEKPAQPNKGRKTQSITHKEMSNAQSPDGEVVRAPDISAGHRNPKKSHTINMQSEEVIEDDDDY